MEHKKKHYCLTVTDEDTGEVMLTQNNLQAVIGFTLQADSEKEKLSFGKAVVGLGIDVAFLLGKTPSLVSDILTTHKELMSVFVATVENSLSDEARQKRQSAGEILDGLKKS